MSKTVFTGTQVKELLSKATGGIYLVGYWEVTTDFLKDFLVVEDSIVFDLKNHLTLNLPISDDEYVNYAVAGEDDSEESLWEVWEGSTYFDYCFEISGYTLCFNVLDKENQLSRKQFKELVDNEHGIFRIASQDGGSVYLEIDNCTISVGDNEIQVLSGGKEVTFDNNIISAIYNDSAELGSVVYRIEFYNGMSDLVIEPESRIVKF
ncbi:hypothetical protein BN3590_02178 [Clostridium sp. C105KSO15]|nr:hypothetical protein BN3590_02178 [Clostridium sp. C105KSO15]